MNDLFRPNNKSQRWILKHPRHGLASFLSYAILLWIVLESLTSTKALAQSEPDDLTIKIGAAAGIISADSVPSSKETPLVIGGIPLTMGYYSDVDQSFSIVYQGQVLMDVFNNQVLRSGAEVGVDYHIFGASRRFTKVPGLLYYLSDFNISLLFRSGIFSYSAVSSESQAIKIRGQVLEFKTGLSMRFDAGDDLSYGFEGISTVTTVASSTDRVEPFIGEFSIFVRKFVY